LFLEFLKETRRACVFLPGDLNHKSERDH
jgi:hypothetical protein